MTPLVSLPMYDFAHVSHAWDQFYAHLRIGFLAAGLDAPEVLARGDDRYDWGGDVFFSMTCGAPFRHSYADNLELVGTLDFGHAGCAAGYYNSPILGEVPDSRPTVWAVNGQNSQSGFHAVAPVVRAGVENHEMVISGAHLASMQMVARGDADLAGVDAQSYRFIVEEHPELADLPIWGYGTQTPSLPFVTSHKDDAALMRRVISEQVKSLDRDVKSALSIKGVVHIPREKYLSVVSFD